MQVHFETRRGVAVHPCKSEFMVLTVVPDRPAGTHEICPVIHLDDSRVVSEIGSVQRVETAVGLMLTASGGWVVIDMRKEGVRAVLALDIGDRMVKRWLDDVAQDGPIVGLRARNVARAVRVPMADMIATLRNRAAAAIPANLEEWQSLVDRLLNHLESGPTRQSGRCYKHEGQSLYLALPLGQQKCGALQRASHMPLMH